MRWLDGITDSMDIMNVRVGPKRKLSTEELMLFNCGVREDLLKVPSTARRSNQSILKEISPEYNVSLGIKAVQTTAKDK